MFGRREINDPAKDPPAPWRCLAPRRGAAHHAQAPLGCRPRRQEHGPAPPRLRRIALTPMRWGLVPEWAQDDARNRPLVSVRAETVAQEIEWRRLLNTRRCVVPADQFFEWKRAGGVKTKEYAFKLKSHRPMMIAGLVESRALRVPARRHARQLRLHLLPREPLRRLGARSHAGDLGRCRRRCLVQSRRNTGNPAGTIAADGVGSTRAPSGGTSVAESKTLSALALRQPRGLSRRYV